MRVRNILLHEIYSRKTPARRYVSIIHKLEFNRMTVNLNTAKILILNLQIG